MADKKKPNFADSLKGAARAVSPATPSEDEVVQIDVGGEVVTVPRGKGANRLDDAAWERVKARALPTENKDMKSKPLGWSDLMGLGQNLDGVADSVVSKEQKDLLKKTDEWTRAEYLRQRFKARGYEVPPNSADDERKSYKDGKKADTVDVGAQKPDQGTPDEWKPMPEQKTGAPTTQTEDDAMVGSAAGVTGSTPMARMASMAQQAATGATGVGNIIPSKQNKLEGARKSADEAVLSMNETALANQRAADRATFGEQDRQINAVAGAQRGIDMMSQPPVTDVGVPQPGMLGKVAGALRDPNMQINIDGTQMPSPEPSSLQDSEPAKTKGFMGALNNFLSPSMPNQAQMAAREDLGLDPLTGLSVPAKVANPAQAPEMPQGEGGSGSMAASLANSMPGGFRVAQTDPEAIKAEREALKQAAEKNREAEGVIQGVAKNQQAALDESVRLQREKMAAGEQLAAEAAQAQREYIVKAEQFENARLSVLAEARKAANNPIDPNRYWNNKDAGQKASAVIASALFGFTGQGMQWLQRLDSLVAQDNQLQAQDRASKVQGLNAEAAGLGEAAQSAMQRGASLAQAKIIEKAAKYESAKAYADQFGMTTQNAQYQMNAANISAQLGAKLADLAQQGHQLASMDAAHTNSARAQNAQLMQEKAKLSVKVAAGGAGGRGRAVSPQLASRVANTKQMIATLKQMKDLAQNGGFFDRMGRKAAEQLSSEEQGKLNQYEAGQFEIARLRAGSSLQKPEQEALLPLLKPRSGRFDPVPGLEQAIQRAEEALRIEEQSAANATGGDLGTTTPTPEFPEAPLE